MRQISVFCLMVVLAACATILSASPVTSPEAAPVPATEQPVAANAEDLFAGAPLQDYEQDYEDDLAGADPEGEDMDADGALIFRPLFAYRRKMERQARRRRQRAHRGYQHGYHHGRYYY